MTHRARPAALCKNMVVQEVASSIRDLDGAHSFERDAYGTPGGQAVLLTHRAASTALSVMAAHRSDARVQRDACWILARIADVLP